MNRNPFNYHDNPPPESARYWPPNMSQPREPERYHTQPRYAFDPSYKHDLPFECPPTYSDTRIPLSPRVRGLPPDPSPIEFHQRPNQVLQTQIRHSLPNNEQTQFAHPSVAIACSATSQQSMFPKSPSNSDEDSSGGACWNSALPAQVGCETSFPASSKSGSEEPVVPAVSYNQKNQEREASNWWSNNAIASRSQSRQRQRRQNDNSSDWPQSDDRGGRSDLPEGAKKPSYRSQEKQQAGRYQNRGGSLNGRHRRSSSNQRAARNGLGGGPRPNIVQQQQQSNASRPPRPSGHSEPCTVPKSVLHSSGLLMGPHSWKNSKIEEKKAEAKNIKPEDAINGDEIRLDLLTIEHEPLPPVKKLLDEEKNQPCYDFLNKFMWNGFRGQSFQEKFNKQLVQKEGHGLGCKCQQCVDILLKEKKVKGDTQDKNSISILHEIASHEGAKIDLWVKCQACKIRFKYYGSSMTKNDDWWQDSWPSLSEEGGKKDSVQKKKTGKPACAHCGTSVHPKTCMYGYKWNDDYLEGVQGAPNQKEAKRMAAERALNTLERKGNYGEQIVRCREGKKGLPKDPGKYVYVSTDGTFSDYGNKVKALREIIFEQHKTFQDIAHRIAPNFEWHKLDKKKKRGSQPPAAVSSVNKDLAARASRPMKQPESMLSLEKEVKSLVSLSDKCKAPAPPIVNARKKSIIWNDEWNPKNEDKLVDVHMKTFWSDGCDNGTEQVNLQFSVEALRSIFYTKYLEDLSYDVKQFYDVVFRRKGEHRYCFMYDRRYVAICHCGGEVVRSHSQHMEGQFNCPACDTVWVYCQGCDQLRWPLEPAEIVCGEKCVANIDTSDNTWYCQNCWKIFIVEKQDENTTFPKDNKWKTNKQAYPVPPPVSTPPPRPPDSCTSEPRGPLMDSRVEASDLPDFDMSRDSNLLPKNLDIVGQKDEEVKLNQPSAPKERISPCLDSLVKDIITWKFERTNEVKREGICFDASFQNTPKIYIRVLTRGLNISVILEDKDAFVAIASLDKNQEPGDYSFEYLAMP